MFRLNGTQIKLSASVGGDGAIIQHITKMVQAGNSDFTQKKTNGTEKRKGRQEMKNDNRVVTIKENKKEET